MQTTVTRKPTLLFIKLAVIICVFAFSSLANAAHPIKLTDTSPQTRISIEIAGGKMIDPLPADFVHYLFLVEADVYPGLHALFAFPFSGYSGIDGADNFIRGNLLTGINYGTGITDWLHIGASLRLYVPTYERAAATDYGFLVDPRRAILTHWHYRFQYALEDSFPITPELLIQFQKWGLFLQIEGGVTYAPNVRKRDSVHRKDHVIIGHYGIAVGYEIFKWLEVGATFTSLADSDPGAKNLGDVMGLQSKEPHTLSVLTLGPRLQYKWFAFSMEVNFPLEKRYRDMLHPWGAGTVQVQF